MQRQDLVSRLIECLLADMPEYRESVKGMLASADGSRRALRGLMNLRPPAPLSAQYVAMQDELLGLERDEKGVVDAWSLPTIDGGRIALWQGDITRLKADAIVNAANSALLGCFSPCHSCIDNAIHSAAGLQLRNACAELMTAQGAPEPTGRAKLTPAYNLPCRYVIHTVGPIISGEPSPRDDEQLADCYRACLATAAQNGCESLALCCLSTGVFHFPNERAAQIAVRVTKEFLSSAPLPRLVIFDVFTPRDLSAYQRALQAPIKP